MERYLLFDSGCNSCTKIADEVEQATAGWLTAQSLRDPAIQRILNDVQPGWQWEPMLLEIVDGKPRVFAGIGMSMRLVVKLGPRRSLRLSKLVAQTHRDQQVRMPVASPSWRRGRGNGERRSFCMAEMVSPLPWPLPIVSAFKCQNA